MQSRFALYQLGESIAPPPRAVCRSVLPVVASALLTLRSSRSVRCTFALSQTIHCFTALLRARLRPLLCVPTSVPDAVGVTVRSRTTDAWPADLLACVVVSSFRSSVRARIWRRLPVFSIGARYQPGAARQKEAVSTITAPFRTPEI